jgi:hypothetical protein
MHPSLHVQGNLAALPAEQQAHQLDHYDPQQPLLVLLLLLLLDPHPLLVQPLPARLLLLLLPPRAVFAPGGTHPKTSHPRSHNLNLPQEAPAQWGLPLPPTLLLLLLLVLLDPQPLALNRTAVC